jgi:integrase
MPKTKAKPDKPRSDFPLFPHATRRWAKKVRGKLHYFGPWADPQGALDKWLDQKDDLLAGRTPRVRGDGLTMRDLANRFLTSKRLLADTHEITEKTFADYYRTCESMIKCFGKSRLVTDLASDDFESLRAELAKVRGPVGLGNEIGRCRVVFKYGIDSGLIDRPMRYGQGFNKPSRRILRHARIAAGPRMFEAKEIRAILDSAGPAMKAMTLLAINGGMGNTDVATIPLSAVDLKAAWLDFPRPKTAVQRRVPLWPQTIKALKDAIAIRPKSKRDEDAGLMFVTKFGERWVRFRRVERDDTNGIEQKEAWIDSVGLEFNKLLVELGIKRPGVGFYTLRRTFETVAGDSKDQVAVDAIMGHSPAVNDMAAVYRQKISDDRLKDVTEHVRKWLFAKSRIKKAKRS